MPRRTRKTFKRARRRLAAAAFKTCDGGLGRLHAFGDIRLREAGPSARAHHGIEQREFLFQRLIFASIGRTLHPLLM